jgi:hypothetical protein
MELKPFTIVALPFEYSDVESEYTVYGVDEEDALKDFRQRHPAFRVKEVKPNE